MLGQRRRRWTSIKSTLSQRLVSAGLNVFYPCIVSRKAHNNTTVTSVIWATLSPSYTNVPKYTGIPAKTRHEFNVGSTSYHYLRHWPNIKSIFDQRYSVFVQMHLIRGFFLLTSPLKKKLYWKCDILQPVLYL